MKIVLNEIGSKYFEIKLEDYSSNLELPQWSSFLHEILHYALQDRILYIVTLSPQSYSLSYELENPTQVKVGRDTVIFNRIENYSDTLLREIVESEEFERGLLRLVILKNQKIEDVLPYVFFQIITDDDVRDSYVDFEIITTEGDGKILSWFNPGIPINDLRLIANKILTKYK